jgi:hypothetical protein
MLPGPFGQLINMNLDLIYYQSKLQDLKKWAKNNPKKYFLGYLILLVILWVVSFKKSSFRLLTLASFLSFVLLDQIFQKLRSNQ